MFAGSMRVPPGSLLVVFMESESCRGWLVRKFLNHGHVQVNTLLNFFFLSVSSFLCYFLFLFFFYSDNFSLSVFSDSLSALAYLLFLFMKSEC